LPLSEGEGVDYCLDCIEDMTVSCACCGGPIFPGDSVGTFIPVRKDSRFPYNFAIHCTDPLQLVSCMRPDCAGYSRSAGVWLPGKDGKGVVVLFRQKDEGVASILPVDALEEEYYKLKIL